MTRPHNLLDTNVLTEPWASRPNARVMSWIEALDDAQILVSAIISEIRYGVRRLPVESDERLRLQRWLDVTLSTYSERILDISLDVANTWSDLRVKCERVRFNLPAVGGLLAATALVHDCIVATRNVGDFKRTGVRTYQPWKGTFTNAPSL